MILLHFLRQGFQGLVRGHEMVDEGFALTFRFGAFGDFILQMRIGFFELCGADFNSHFQLVIGPLQALFFLAL